MFALNSFACGFCLIIAATSAPLSPAVHVYPDGFVERAFAVVIRDEVATCEYSIGLNPKTAELLLLRLSQKGQAKQESAHSDSPVAATSRSPEDQLSSKPQSADAKPDARTSPKAMEHVGGGEHLTDPVVIKQFSKHVKTWLARDMQVRCNGKRVNVEKIEVSAEARHPFSMVLRFQFAVAPNQASSVTKTSVSNGKPDAVELEIMDGLFPKTDGAIRYALKTKGKTMLANSNVAPILVRADRIELGKLRKLAAENGTDDDEWVKKISKIKARLIFSQSKPKLSGRIDRQ